MGNEPGEIVQPNPSLAKCAETLTGDANPFRMYDDANSNEVNLLKAITQELNQITAAPVSVYLLLDTKIDKLYGEDKDTRYSQPILDVVGHYSPQQVKFTLSMFGIDSDIDTVFYFTRDELMSKLGRLMQHGDLIYNSDRQLFEVTEVTDDTNFKYEWVNQYVLCRRKLGETSLLLGEYDNPQEISNMKDLPPESAGDLPPSPAKTKDDIKFDDLYGEKL